MKVRFQQLVMVVLMLFAQLQPLQVHALVLDAEQSGHVAGQLSHSHASAEHDHTQGGQEDDHESPCHPSHTPLPLVNFYLDACYPRSSHYSPRAVGFISADLALDTPPPKTFAS